MDPCTLEIFFEVCVFKRYVQKLKRNWNNSGRIKVDNFRESVSLLASQQSALIKN